MTENSQRNWLHTFLDQDGRVVFLALCIVQIALIFIQEDIIGFRADFFDLLRDTGNTGMLYLLLRLKEIGGYIIVPLQIFMQLFFAGLMLWIGTFTFGYKIEFKASLKISALSYIAFFVPQILKILWFGFINRDYSQFGLDHFHNFSLAVFWSPENRLGLTAELAKSINPGLFIYLWLTVQLLAIVMKRNILIALPIVLTFIFGIGLLWKVFTGIVG